MFIKKDKRKIPQILADPEDNREYLKLAKRSFEFQSGVKIICSESNLSALKNLKVFNLYDNGINDLTGIGLLANTPLEEINLGNNRLTMIPLEFGEISTLRSIWLDNNELEDFPVAICNITELVALRLSMNRIQSVPHSICSLVCLETLSLDNNALTEFPEGCIRLRALKHLWLRQNKISEIPSCVAGLKNSLETLSLSSNLLTELPEILSELTVLRKLYANGNQISKVHASLASCAALEDVTLSNNAIASVPSAWTDKWGVFDAASGNLKPAVSDGKVVIKLFGNPVAE